VNVDHHLEGRGAFPLHRSECPGHSRGRRQAYSKLISELPSQIIEALVTKRLRRANNGRIACPDLGG
jgi:hypothetical protein